MFFLFVTEQYTFYRTIDYLIQNQFNIIYFSTDQEEFILHKYDSKVNHIVRLKRKTFDWSNHLKLDVEQRMASLIQQNQLFRGSETHFHFVFISDLAPVDDWEHLKRTVPIRKNKKNSTLTVYFFDEDGRNDELLRLSNETKVKSPIPLFETLPSLEEQERQTLYLEQKIVQTERAREREFKEVFHFGKIRFTFLLIAINIIIFILLESNGDSTNILHLIDWGAKFNQGIADGEWWRIITSMFLHIGFFHLLMNMLALYFLGEITERIYGSKRFLFIYFTAGIFGGIASFATNSAVAAGASGAIFGLFGALLFFGLHYKRLFFQTIGANLLIIIGINIVFGLTVPQIDNGAHIGGLIGGFLAAQVIHLPKKKERFKQIATLILLLTVIITMIIYGTNRAYTSVDPATVAAIAQHQIDEGNFDKALELLTEPIESGEEHEFLYFYRSLVYIEYDDIEKATSDLLNAIEINDEFAEAYYNLGVLFMQENEIDAAWEYVQKAVELDPDEEFYRPLYERLENLNKR